MDPSKSAAGPPTDFHGGEKSSMGQSAPPPYYDNPGAGPGYNPAAGPGYNQGYAPQVSSMPWKKKSKRTLPTVVLIFISRIELFRVNVFCRLNLL